MRRLSASILVMVATVFSMALEAQQKPSAYPAKGQTAEQKTVDDGECLTWARQDTGIDPDAIAAAPAESSGRHGERMAGAARGAAAGAVIGDSSKAAGTGAAIGVVAGGRHARHNQAAQSQHEQAAKEQSMDTYYRAYGACMQGRGYTVN